MSKPFVRTVPTDYSAEFIAEHTGADSWLQVDTSPDNDPDNSVYVFVYDDETKEALLDITITNYDTEYTSWALPEYANRVDMKLYIEFLDGFTVPVGVGGLLSGHNLQTRDIDDRTNWLTSQAAYKAQIEAGFGDIPGATFRTTANVTVTCTYAEGYQALLAMAAWGSDIFKRSWALKDALAAATTRQELDAVIADLDNGWPSSTTA